MHMSINFGANIFAVPSSSEKKKKKKKKYSY